MFEWMDDCRMIVDVFAKTSGVADHCTMGVLVVHNQMCVCRNNAQTEGTYLCKGSAHCCPQRD